MINLLRINALNFEDIFNDINSSQKQDFLSSLKDCFLYAPHKSELICKLIISLCKENQDLVHDIKDLVSKSFMSADNIDSKVSVLVYAKCLNYRAQINAKSLENDFFKDEIINLDNELEINEYLNNLEIFLDKTNFSNINEISLFKIICIIKNYQFDIYDCIDELKKECDCNQEYIGILYLANTGSNTKSFFLINLLLRSLHDKEGVDALFRILPFMQKSFRDRLIPFIHEYFINRRVFKHSQEIKFLFDTTEELTELKKHIDGETVKEMMKYMSTQSLDSFVPEFKSIYEVDVIVPIKKEDFNLELKSTDKKAFYKDFCLLGSPSITHFLSYLEIYKEDMNMDEDDEKLFLEIFDEVFGNRPSFKNIVLGKMRKFKFLKEECVQ